MSWRFQTYKKRGEPNGGGLEDGSGNTPQMDFAVSIPCDSPQEAQQKFEDLQTTVQKFMASETYSKDFEFDVSTPNVVAIKSRTQDESQESLPKLTIKREAPADTSHEAATPTGKAVDVNLPPEEKSKENIQVTVENLAGNQAMIEMIETVMPKEGPLYVNECGNTNDVLEFVKAFGDRIRIPNNLLEDQKQMQQLKSDVAKELQSKLGENCPKSKVEDMVGKMFYEPAPPAKHARYSF